MPKQTFTVICLLLVIGVFSNARAQAVTDSVNNSALAYNNTIDKFYTAIGPQSRLYNGEDYVPDYVAIKGNPYYNDATDWGLGNINYDGYFYKNINIRYDLYKDEVIIPLYKSVIQISLINNKMTSFDLYGHHFIYIKNDPAVEGSLASGFYDELYHGKIRLLCKRSMSLQQDRGIDYITTYFLPSTHYFIFKDNQYYAVNGKSEFLGVLKDKKRDVRQYVSSNKIKFKKISKEQDMLRVTEYYDHLSQ